MVPQYYQIMIRDLSHQVKHLYKKINFLVIIYVLTTFLSCMPGGGGINSNEKKYGEKLSEFLLYSQLFSQPEMLVFPYDGESSVSPETDIKIIFNRPVEKSA